MFLLFIRKEQWLRARKGQKKFNKFSLFLFKGWHRHEVTTIRLGTKKDKENKELQKRS
jgi:hypothetical protein